MSIISWPNCVPTYNRVTSGIWLLHLLTFSILTQVVINMASSNLQPSDIMQSERVFWRHLSPSVPQN